ncbi:hypothetical protein [Shewanella psychropiezotolerans]|uniref:hypothetical protein n=1 Tax=Shewanella psychropiezotolerans TaxID=2593655 RepID=UPI001E4FE702|nr:hypothetical protein [Shewanella psychropiezotolerans]
MFKDAGSISVESASAGGQKMFTCVVTVMADIMAEGVEGHNDKLYIAELLWLLESVLQKAVVWAMMH